MKQENIRSTYNQDTMTKWHIYHKSRAQLFPVEYGIIRASTNSTRDQVLLKWNEFHPDTFRVNLSDPNILVSELDYNY